MTGGSRDGFPRAPTTSALRVIRHSQVGGRREIGRGKRKERAEAGVGQRHGGDRELGGRFGTSRAS